MTDTNPAAPPTRRPLTAEEVRELGVIADRHREALALRRNLDKPRKGGANYLYLTDGQYGDGYVNIALPPDIAGPVLDALIANLADAAIERYGIVLATPAQEPSR